MHTYLTNPNNGDPQERKTTLGPSGTTPHFSFSQGSWWKNFTTNLKDYLTERPVKLPQSAPKGAPFTDESFGDDFLDNMREWFRPLPKYARAARPTITPGSQSSRMGVVDWKPLYRTVWESIRDLVAPRKQAPLKITSKPVKVREIWSRDENFNRVQALSMVAHATLAVLLLVPLFHEVATTHAQVEVTPIDISPYLPKLPAGKERAGGGGGGGERNPVPASKGRLPRWSMTQFAKPMVKPRNPNPKLPMEATLAGPPELRVPSPALPNYGDPLASLITDSSGPGGGGGIGTGSGGGIGSGKGGGLGPGEGGGTGGGIFRAGTGGVGTPGCMYCPRPNYSEEARKAKYQGTVLVQVVITADGRPTNIRVLQSPGMGLDEKVIEAVRNWRFRPATGPNGQPVAVVTQIEVAFRLL